MIKETIPKLLSPKRERENYLPIFQVDLYHPAKYSRTHGPNNCKDTKPCMNAVYTGVY
jgi:hypothetical protein